MKILLNTFYTLFVLCVICIALLFLGSRLDFFGYQIKIVQSGSMEPAIMTGGIILTAPAQSYAVGDVITFGKDTRTLIPTTHRIVGVETSPLGRTLYTTKGDANEEADPVPVRTHEILGKVLLDVPYVGYVLELARTPLGFLLLIGLPALLIIFDEFADIIWEIRKYHARKRKLTAQKNVPLNHTTPAKKPDSRATRRIVMNDIKRISQPKTQSVSHKKKWEDFDLDLRLLKPYRRV